MPRRLIKQSVQYGQFRKRQIIGAAMSDPRGVALAASRQFADDKH